MSGEFTRLLSYVGPAVSKAVVGGRADLHVAAEHLRKFYTKIWSDEPRNEVIPEREITIDGTTFTARENLPK